MPEVNGNGLCPPSPIKVNGDCSIAAMDSNKIESHVHVHPSYPEVPPQSTIITLLHFNDCYNIEPRAGIEPAGGAARFKSALKYFKKVSTIDGQDRSIVLFSGDILGPSIMSTFTKGEQMIPVLNECEVECAVFGNHDFDYGLDNLIGVTEKTKFPWLMSNVLDVDTSRPLAEGKIIYVIERCGKRLGIIGLVEEEWLATLSTIETGDVTYLDFVSEGRKLARYLKEKEKVDYVIALTHMRSPNDCRLAENVDEIDLILGGHDHDYELRKVNGKLIVKSGTDFRTFSKIDLVFHSAGINNGNNNLITSDDQSGRPFVDVTVTEICVNSYSFPEDSELKEQLDKYSDIIEGKMDTVLGQFACDMDGRFASIRTQETNLGNFVCDIMLASTKSDCAILNSGTLRSDRIHPKGDFKLRDLVTIMPMMDAMIVLSATGEQIWKALENGVSQWPKLEGRFPQVAGLKFAFDPSKARGQRIDPRFIKIGDDYLDLKQKYRLVTKGYLHQGKDGYTALKECEVLVDPENCPELCTSIQNHFEAIRIVKSQAGAHTRHHQSIVPVSRRHSSVFDPSLLPPPPVETSPLSSSSPSSTSGSPLQKNPLLSKMRHLSLDSSRKNPSGRRLSIEDIEMEQCKLEPKVEGRIVIINDEVIRSDFGSW